jgi:hypothetical protein
MCTGSTCVLVACTVHYMYICSMHTVCIVHVAVHVVYVHVHVAEKKNTKKKMLF